MSSRFLSLLYSIALVSGCAAVGSANDRQKPNVIVILADDLGIVDMNAYASKFTGANPAEMYYETPNLDRLAKDGLAFSQAYACHLCSPARASLLTGKYAARTGFTTAVGGNVRTFYNQAIEPPQGYVAQDALVWQDKIEIQQALLNGTTRDALASGQPSDNGQNETTLAEAMPDHDSAFIGKWHLGGHGSQGWQPSDQGFEQISYFDEGGSPYFNWRDIWDSGKKLFPNTPQVKLLRGKSGGDLGQEYLTDELTEHAIAYLRGRADSQASGGKPFFLHFCHFAVHTPFHGRADDVAHFELKPTRGWNGHDNAVYAAMLKRLDVSVGRILDTLEATGLDENTLVVFMSDNGGVTYTDPVATNNAPFKGGKALHFEGGIRVPLVIRWKGHVDGDRWSHVPVDCNDIFPTVMDLAGYDVAQHIKPGGIDGRSLAPLLDDPANVKNGYERETFFWHYPLNVIVKNPEDGLPSAPSSAVREGDWKLIFDWSGVLRLYNIANDPFEQKELSAAMPDKAHALFVKLNDWIDQSVDVKYTPAINPAYEPAKESRKRPFVDLRRKFLGADRAIRTIENDPRFSLIPAGIKPHVNTSDHGMPWPFAKWSLYETGIRTPLIAVWPGKIKPNSSTDAMVSWIDLIPTLIDLAGGTSPSGIDGRSFAKVLTGEAAQHRDVIYATHKGDNEKNVYPIRSVRVGNWKYIRNLHPEFAYTTHTDVWATEVPRIDGHWAHAGHHWQSYIDAAKTDPKAAAFLHDYHSSPAEELYDIRSDPFETENLAESSQHRGKLEELRKLVVARMSEVGDDQSLSGPPRLLQDFPLPKIPATDIPFVPSARAAVHGGLIAWHPLSIDFAGPTHSETDNDPNPFLDYRLQVIFKSPSGTTYNVPGYFDGNGNGSQSGNVWRVMFTPDRQGAWTYQASFRSGKNAAVSSDADAGETVSFDGAQGSFVVAPRDANAHGFLKWGRLEYVGGHYLKFRDGPYWIRGGVDSPENFLAYAGFHNTPPSHRYADHVEDWNEGDPDWNDGSGRAIIGAINSLSSQKVNSLYFLTMNIGGDGGDVWPWAGQPNRKGDARDDNLHFDVKKLRQWETVFAHAERCGINLHFVFNEAETANKKELDDGELGIERKLYYREMIARFGHHNALSWNLCEEYNIQFNFGPERIRSFADYIRATDPYDHPISVHSAHDPLAALRFTFGDSRFGLTSIQLNQRRIDTLVEEFREATAAAGRPLPVSMDEFTLDVGQDASWKPFNRPGLHRKQKLWPTLLSGGQIEFILEDLLGTESFKTPDLQPLWKSVAIARTFMEDHLPFWEMLPSDTLIDGAATIDVGLGSGKSFQLGAQVFQKPNAVYAIYFPTATQTGRLDLTGADGTFQARWFNPRIGRFEGSDRMLQAGDWVKLGSSPSHRDQDWVLLLSRALN